MGEYVIKRNKGNNIIDFISDYMVIDIETTGLDPSYDKIIEVSAIKYRDSLAIDSFSSLLKQDPFTVYELDDGDEFIERVCYVDDFITELTGITNEMLSNAPDAEDVLIEFYNFIKDDILIGHNVNFDINFLYDNFKQYLNIELSNNYIDTMRIARRLLPDLNHHRLRDLSRHYSISYEGAHRALKDCDITSLCYKNLESDMFEQFGELNVFLSTIKKKPGVTAAMITSEKTDFDISHPIFNNVFVFTGILEKMPRKEAMQIVADLGGINGDRVTSKTNYLVLGNNDYCKSIKDGKSNKQKMAEKLKLSEKNIEIITENVFYDMID